MRRSNGRSRFQIAPVLLAGLLLSACVSAGRPEPSGVPPGATVFMEYWTDRGTLWALCIHDSCVKDSLVSLRPQGPRPVPSHSEFLGEQMRLVDESRAKMGDRASISVPAKPVVRRSGGVTTMTLRGRVETPGEPVAYMVRGMVYCGSESISVVSTSTNRSRAEAMFGYGYGLCRKR